MLNNAAKTATAYLAFFSQMLTSSQAQNQHFLCYMSTLYRDK